MRRQLVRNHRWKNTSEPLADQLQKRKTSSSLVVASLAMSPPSRLDRLVSRYVVLWDTMKLA